MRVNLVVGEFIADSQNTPCFHTVFDIVQLWDWLLVEGSNNTYSMKNSMKYFFFES